MNYIEIAQYLNFNSDQLKEVIDTFGFQWDDESVFDDEQVALLEEIVKVINEGLSIGQAVAQVRENVAQKQQHQEFMTAELESVDPLLGSAKQVATNDYVGFQYARLASLAHMIEHGVPSSTLSADQLEVIKQGKQRVFQAIKKKAQMGQKFVTNLSTEKIVAPSLELKTSYNPMQLMSAD